MKPNIQIWGLDAVKPYSKNVKKHPPEQVAQIAQSIKKFGWTQPIVVDVNGTVIAGHGRRLAAISLGLTEVPVWVRDDLTTEQVKALRLADNRVAESEIDTYLLQEELKALDYDLSGIFLDKELDFFTADLDAINDGAFVDDLDAEVRAQAEETAAKIADVDRREVKIADALGFKAIQGTDERVVAGYVALIESETGLQGAAAFVAHAKHYLENQS